MRAKNFSIFLLAKVIAAETKEELLEEYKRKNPELHNQMRGSTGFNVFNFDGEPTEQPPKNREKGEVTFEFETY